MHKILSLYSGDDSVMHKLRFGVWERGRHWQPNMCIYVPSLWHCLPSVGLGRVSRTLKLRCLYQNGATVPFLHSCEEDKVLEIVLKFKSSHEYHLYLLQFFDWLCFGILCIHRFIARQPYVFSILSILLQLVFPGGIDNIFVPHKL